VNLPAELRTDLPPIEALVPHREPMLLLDRIVECDERCVRAVYTVRADAWYADAGAMPAWIALELMAQAVAAYSGYNKAGRGLPPAQGYLLGTRRFRSARASYAAGTTLHVIAEKQYQEPSGLGAFDCRIEIDGARVADATLTVFEPA
jgi:predicted hotdog family 3-hydroxylacyl-ACP dehydratase